MTDETDAQIDARVHREPDVEWEQNLHPTPDSLAERPVRWWRRCRSTFPAYMRADGEVVPSERCWLGKLHHGNHRARTMPMQSKFFGNIYVEVVTWHDSR